MKILLITIGLGLLACSQTKPTKQQEPMIVSSCDTTITLKPNASFTIQLPITQGTGFDWHIASQSNAELLLPPPQEVVLQNQNGEKDGAQDIQVIKLTAKEQKGTNILTLHYSRSFEKNKAPEKVCTLTIIVK